MATASGSSGLPNARNKKNSGTRRSWSDTEEACLLVALKKIVAAGWRSENGFKAGYLNKLEDAMKEKFPSTDLRAMPHINSKITQWKKTHGSLLSLLSRSGVGFNSRGDFMIECENELWDQITNGDAVIKNMRYKPWPHYEDWCTIFGKDRATGEAAEDMMDAANDLSAEDPSSNMGNFEEFSPFAEDDNEVEGEGYSASGSAKHNVTSKDKCKRRKTGGDLEAVCDVLGEIGNKADARLGEMVKRMGFDFDVKNTKKEAFKELDFIPGLTIKQKFVVCQILAKEVDKLDVFMGLPEEERPSYVLFILEEAGYL